MLDRTLSDVRDHSTATNYRPSGSVLPIFGQNLRLLTSMRGTQAKVSADLGIGRVQFQRYLRGESFPKPNVLRNICDYFMVDARILTHKLDDDLIRDMVLARKLGPQLGHQSAWLSAIGFAASNQNYFDEQEALEEGHYVMWQWCSGRKNTVLRKLFKIYRQDGVTVMRGYAPRESFPPRTPLREREYRGICLSLRRQGYALLTFTPQPSQMISMSYVTPIHLTEHSRDALVGFHAITRDELPELPRLSRIVVERLEPSASTLLSQAHMPSYYSIEDLPAGIADILETPIA